MNVRAVIFDVYGTLLEVGPPPPDADARWQRLFRELLQVDPRLTRLDFSVAAGRVIARHHEAARARAIPWPEVQWPAVVVEVLPELARMPGPDREEFIFRHIQTGHTTRMPVEAADTLRWLKDRGFLLGIASNAQAYTLQELQAGLGTHGLGMELFEPALRFWSFEHGFSKPDPHVFQDLTTRLAGFGVTPRETLMVGDRLDNDIAPAQAHGWQAWQVGASGEGDWAGLRDVIRCG
jgi:putative hydrolase of the HAD superfamily